MKKGYLTILVGLITLMVITFSACITKNDLSKSPTRFAEVTYIANAGYILNRLIIKF